MPRNESTTAKPSRDHLAKRFELQATALFDKTLTPNVETYNYRLRILTELWQQTKRRRMHELCRRIASFLNSLHRSEDSSMPVSSGGSGS
jgi:hypothetical protein